MTHSPAGTSFGYRISVPVPSRKKGLPELQAGGVSIPSASSESDKLYFRPSFFGLEEAATKLITRMLAIAQRKSSRKRAYLVERTGFKTFVQVLFAVLIFKEM
jgi:hypothetical protein